MLVFIDESGDPGFQVAKGSSPVFVMAMVMFADGDAARRTGQAIEAVRTECGLTTEFKFNKSRDVVRDAFFQGVSASPFRVRAIVVEKARIRSARLRETKEEFYRFFLKTMVKFDNGRLAGARVVIDGSGDRTFKRDLAQHLRRHAGEGAIKSVSFKDSKNDGLVQLADMCAGAVARSYRGEDRKEAGRWRTMLRPKLDDVWDFR